MLRHGLSFKILSWCQQFRTQAALNVLFSTSTFFNLFRVNPACGGVQPSVLLMPVPSPDKWESFIRKRRKGRGVEVVVKGVMVDISKRC